MGGSPVVVGDGPPEQARAKMRAGTMVVIRLVPDSSQVVLRTVKGGFLPLQGRLSFLPAAKME